MISDSQLLRIRDYIFESSGLWFGDSKLPVLANRIKMRFKAMDMDDADRYLRIIASPDDRAEFEILINSITTNETYFYRCESQMDSFRQIVLPRIVDKKIAAGDRSLRIWSAGCSTGEEPYTLAVSIFETLQFHSIWDITVYATDISTEVLTRALEGKYGKRAVEKMPKDLLDKYFVLKDGVYYINNAVKKVVEFEYMNLTDAWFDSGYDIIFCRNVLIYFRDDTKRDLLNKFHDSLKDDGFLFLGPTEMIRGLAEGFKMVSLKDAVAFQKVPR